MGDPQSKMLRNIIILTFVILILVFASIYQSLKKPPAGKFISVLDQERELLIIRNLKQMPEMQSISFNDYTIDMLDQDEINDLAVKDPLIYEGLYAGLYKVELKGDKGMLLFYDLSTNTIIRKFNVLSPQLS